MLKTHTEDFPVAKSLPANAGTLVRSLVPEDSTSCGPAKPVGHNY